MGRHHVGSWLRPRGRLPPPRTRLAATGHFMSGGRDATRIYKVVLPRQHPPEPARRATRCRRGCPSQARGTQHDLAAFSAAEPLAPLLLPRRAPADRAAAAPWRAAAAHGLPGPRGVAPWQIPQPHDVLRAALLAVRGFASSAPRGPRGAPAAPPATGAVARLAPPFVHCVDGGGPAAVPPAAARLLDARVRRARRGHDELHRARGCAAPRRASAAAARASGRVRRRALWLCALAQK